MKHIFVIPTIFGLLSSFLGLPNAFSQNCGLSGNQSSIISQVMERSSNRRFCQKQIQLSLFSRKQVNAGYHFNDVVYAGAIFRIPYLSDYELGGLNTDSSEEQEG